LTVQLQPKTFCSAFSLVSAFPLRAFPHCHVGLYDMGRQSKPYC
jgi:hypothetical protein